MNYSKMELDDLQKALGTDLESGLSANAARRKKRGANVIKVKKRAGFFKKLVVQMSDFMTVVLLLAAAVSYISAGMRGEHDFFEPLLIVAIVLLNSLLGVFQERRAERAIDALKKLSDPHSTVLRDGKWIKIAAEDIVAGDIVRIETGDKIAADMRIIEAIGLETDESALTGESMPAAKEVCTLTEELPLAERRNMLYSATSVTSGRGRAVVCDIGMDTEMGKIAGFIMDEEEEQTPLQKKLAALGKTLGLGALAICAAIFAIGVAKHLAPLDMFITAVSLAVAAIPEGLPATVTVMLAIGVERMARRNAIVKRLSAVETLGAATVICTDKTGTLTENRMTVSEVYSEDERFMAEIARLCCDSGTSPTEAAIISYCNKTGSAGAQAWSRIDEKPFDSSRKMMSVLVGNGSKKRVCVKGAAEIVLKKCTSVRTRTDEKPLSAAERGRLLKHAEKMAAAGLRVLSTAYADASELIEKNLVFCGFIGISDPPRREALPAVQQCRRAGIQVVMVTGDHAATAAAIAKQVGIMTGRERVISGRELEAMSDEELTHELPTIRVFARVTPEQKLRIIKAFKARGDIAAMTGDGVNDAPALKAADIGCSMGKCGTDVAKEASDMVLADDNFATIVSAVSEGRRIFANIRKSVLFLLSSNIGELLCVFLGLLFGWAAPLIAPQLLWINLVTDSLPAVALGLDPAARDIMDHPSAAKGGLFSRTAWLTILTEGAMIGALALLAYTIGAVFFDVGSVPVTGRTMAFIVLALSQLVHAFNLRTEGSVLGKGLFENKYLVLSFLAGTVLTAALVNIPQTARLFGVCALTSSQWFICAALSAAPLLIVELAKKAERIFNR